VPKSKAANAKPKAKAKARPKSAAKASSSAKPSGAATAELAKGTLAWLARTGTKKVKDGMARYAIPSDKAFGVSVGELRAYAKRLGKNHELALALWKTDRYEARMLVSFLADPEQLTPEQMERWCRDFDSWAICDTLCFHLFDRSPHAWPKLKAWAKERDEFVRRAAFALLASLSVHDERAEDTEFARGLGLIEKAATDERNFVKKAVNWALRSIGKRNRALNAAAVALAERLARSESPAARWCGKDALRELKSPGLARRLARTG
jgi:3-methyladenine DNA glycosylase AlkD